MKVRKICPQNIKICKNNQNHKPSLSATYKVKHSQDSSKTGANIWKWSLDKYKAEMKFMRKIAGFTLLDNKRNEEILESLKVEPVSKFIQNCRANWTDHMERSLWTVTDHLT
jgi:hypothetical protein